MPRFFFHIQDGKSLPDDEGTELLNWDVARLEAISVAGRIISDSAKSIPLGEDWRMEVTDESGLVLFRIDFHVTASPAVRSDKLKREKPA